MMRKSMPSGYDRMDGYRLSEKIMLEQRDRVRQPLEEKSSQIGKPVAKMPLRSQMKLKRAICPEF
jgi:hypothetical protein